MKEMFSQRSSDNKGTLYNIKQRFKLRYNHRICYILELNAALYVSKYSNECVIDIDLSV